jgi:hypothetical protein
LDERRCSKSVPLARDPTPQPKPEITMNTKLTLLAPFVLAALVGCSGGSGTGSNIGSTSEALRGTITSVDTAAHHLSLHTSKGEVEASWGAPELRHGSFSNLTVNKEIELHGHHAENEKSFDVDAIELEPGDDKGGTEPGDDKGGGSQPGDDKGGATGSDGGVDDHSDGGAGSDAEVRGSDGGVEDAGTGADADSRGGNGGKGKP